MMLAIGTIGMWIIGPDIIGYIPIMVVGALIFYLGLELLREALYDTWGKVHRLEYLTVSLPPRYTSSLALTQDLDYSDRCHYGGVGLRYWNPYWSSPGLCIIRRADITEVTNPGYVYWCHCPINCAATSDPTTLSTASGWADLCDEVDWLHVFRHYYLRRKRDT